MRRRQGFTLVELLVAMALIIFIMVILTEAFTAGLETFRQLKAIGDMQERMRSALVILRRDLLADHFETDTRGSRLSDQDMRFMDPPDKGFFRLWQVCQNATDNPPFNCSTPEGVDADGIPATRATDHVLQFTVRLRGGSPQSFFVGQLPFAPPFPNGPYSPNGQLANLGSPDFRQPNSMISQWAEVAYFLRQKPGVTAGGTPLYALYRRQRLLGPDNTVVLPGPDNKYGPPGNEAWEWQFYTDVSFPQPVAIAAPLVADGTVVLNGPVSITVPTNRLGMDPAVSINANYAAGVPSVSWSTLPPPPVAAPTPTGVWSIEEILGGPTQPQSGDDVLLTDVLSFDVKMLQQGYNQPNGNPYTFFVDLPHSGSLLSGNSTFQNYVTPTTPFGVSVFDTWTKSYTWNTPTSTTAQSLPLKMRILALQITLRVWDERSQQARQMTIIQEM
jgi:prepilin-type N-terminal cleavage/methylation domain-containing protein